MKSIGRIPTVMLTMAVIITMCFAGNQLTADASTAGQIKAATVSFSLSESGHNVTVHWKTVKGASGYQIANDATPGKRMKIQWTGRNGNNKYTSVRKTAGRTYRYKMRCFVVQNGVRVYSKWSSNKSLLFTAGNKPATPKITKASSTKTSVTLTWSKAKKADGYRVYKYNGKNYVKIKTLKARTYTVKKLKAGTTYKFKVRAYNNEKGKTYYSDMSKVKIIKTKAVSVKASVSDVTVDSGSTATFKVTVTAGTKPYIYQWYKGGTAIAGATSDTYTTRKLSTSDSGTKYTCRVTNSAGYIEATGTLTVNKAMMPLSVSVADQSAVTGSAATFSAATSNGSGSYTYQWYKKSMGNTDFVKIEGATSSAYSPQTGTTGKVTMQNNGVEYKCVVTDSSSNTASATGKLTVTGATEVGNWNIGAANGTTDYDGSNGTSDVIATLYSDGELAVTGTGNTVVFHVVKDAPWCEGTYKAQVKSSTIVSTVKPTNMLYWYNGCSNLTTVPTIPSSVEKIGYTFLNCMSLTNAPDLTGCTNLTDMDSTFIGCTSLTDMSGYVIPASVTNMNGTFYNCLQLTNAPVIPSGVDNMDGTFGGCTHLMKAPDITKCTSLNSMVGTFDGCTSLPADMSSYIIPAGVENMTATFSGCTQLTKAPVMPSGVNNMGSTFRNCTHLIKAPEIPSGVLNMDFTFQDCTGLVTGPSVIPAGVTSMRYTFKNCTALTDTMQINASLNQNYEDCFINASTNAGTNLTVYGSTAANNEITVREIVENTKSTTSNISYGGLR